MYPDKILIGTDNILAGNLQQLAEDVETREVIYNYMKHEAGQIKILNDKRGTRYEPCLLIQADKQIPCQYITQLVKIGAGASFANIYFSTLQDENWLQATASEMKQGE
jgi:hypothetical protein